MKIYYEIYSKVGKGLSLAIDKAVTYKRAKKLKKIHEAKQGAKLYIDKWTEDENGKHHSSRCHEANADEILLHVEKLSPKQEKFERFEDVVYS